MEGLAVCVLAGLKGLRQTVCDRVGRRRFVKSISQMTLEDLGGGVHANMAGGNWVPKAVTGTAPPMTSETPVLLLRMALLTVWVYIGHVQAL
jgi:hypothetical protein